MADFEHIMKMIYDFSKVHNLDEVKNTNDGFNLQVVFSNDEMEVQFLRDRGEFSIYFNFLKIQTRRDLYSLNIVAEILSKEIIRDSAPLYQLNYFERNRTSIYDLFKTDKKIDEKYNVLFNKLFDW